MLTGPNQSFWPELQYFHSCMYLFIGMCSDEEEDAYVIPSYLVDSDGLPLLYDPVQTLLYKRKAQDDRKMADLVAQNRKLQSLLQKANISNHSLPNSVSSGSSLNSLQPIVPLEEEVSDGSVS